jgi:hypothetical protein
MKKAYLFLVLFAITAASTYAQEEVKDTIVVVKSYDKGDMVINTGVTMMASGAVSILASRLISVGLISTGGIVTVTGIIIKVSNRRKNGNR